MSANSGDEIYNRVVVEGTGPDGSPLRVERRTTDHAGETFDYKAKAQPTNPSFDVDASGWAGTGTATVSRHTADFNSSPASGYIGLGSMNAPSMAYTTVSGLTSGRGYEFRAFLKGAPGSQLLVFADTTDGQGLAFEEWGPSTTWIQRSVEFVAPSSGTVVLMIGNEAASSTMSSYMKPGRRWPTAGGSPGRKSSPSSPRSRWTPRKRSPTCTSRTIAPLRSRGRCASR